MHQNVLPFHKKDFDSNNKNERGQHHPVPFLSNRARNEIVAFVAEFGGTFMFLFFVFGAAQVANAAAVVANGAGGQQENHSITQAPNTSVLLFISLAFGFSLAVNVWVFFRISGGLFNPAVRLNYKLFLYQRKEAQSDHLFQVTLGLYLIGAVNPLRAILCFIAQMLAGMAAAGVVSAILPGPLNVSTSLGGGTTIAQGVFLEMFLTAELVFTIFMLAAEKHKATYLAPIGIGLSLFVAEMTGNSPLTNPPHSAYFLTD